MCKSIYSCLFILLTFTLQSQDYKLANVSLFDSDVKMENRAEPGCQIVHDGIDQTENIYIKALEEEDLFSFTPSELKKQFTHRPLIECSGQALQMGQDFFIKMNILINSNNARDSYGVLENGSMLRIKLSDRDQTVIYGYNFKKNKGKINKDADKTLYRGHYKIDEKDYKILKKHDISHMGIVWSQGYELYDVYNVDFVRRALQCLDE